MWLNWLITLYLIFSLSSSYAALNNGKEGNITINSKRLEIDVKANTAIFSGEVRSKQKDTQIKSEKVLINYDFRRQKKVSRNSISKIEFYDGVEIITPKESAKGDYAYYKNDMFYLIGNVTMNSADGVLNGEKFIHNYKTGRSRLVNAKGAASMGNKVIFRTKKSDKQ